MHTLIQYHTIQANPNYFWENVKVGQQLKNKEITSYEQYEKACESAGCLCYSEDLFIDYLKATFKQVTIKDQSYLVAYKPIKLGNEIALDDKVYEASIQDVDDLGWIVIYKF